MQGTGSAKSIVALARGTCALDREGKVHCWGQTPLSLMGRPLPSESFAELHASADAACGVRADRSYSCFMEATSGPDIAVRKLAYGYGSLCGIDTVGTAFCSFWLQDALDLSVPAGERLRDISVGNRVACGVRDTDGTLLCWGSNGTTNCTVYPARAGQLEAPTGSFKELWTRGITSCALRDDDSLACWGAGAPGDDPAELYCNAPANHGQATPPAGAFRSVSIGLKHACGVRADGTVACWGAGTEAREDCGLGGATHCGQSAAPSGTFVEVAAGGFHSCAMTADRKIECWGWNGDGQASPPAAFR
jgi:hypothetical protein